eukprot:FR735733.1.p2 GENE.FR735733.1~~FR735733.1.p2  ORF type:complete len:124 (-),score=40.83 FR735733.1:961-1284(-)
MRGSTERGGGERKGRGEREDPLQNNLPITRPLFPPPRWGWVDFSFKEQSGAHAKGFSPRGERGGRGGANAQFKWGFLAPLPFGPPPGLLPFFFFRVFIVLGEIWGGK